MSSIPTSEATYGDGGLSAADLKREIKVHELLRHHEDVMIFSASYVGVATLASSLVPSGDVCAVTRAAKSCCEKKGKFKVL